MILKFAFILEIAELRLKVRIREEFLQKRADEAKFNNKRTQRMKGADEEQETIDRKKKIQFIPFIPRSLFFEHDKGSGCKDQLE